MKRLLFCIAFLFTSHSIAQYKIGSSNNIALVGETISLNLLSTVPNYMFTRFYSNGVLIAQTDTAKILTTWHSDVMGFIRIYADVKLMSAVKVRSDTITVYVGTWEEVRNTFEVNVSYRYLKVTFPDSLILLQGGTRIIGKSHSAITNKTTLEMIIPKARIQ